MPKVILTSKSAVFNKTAGAPYPGVVEALKAAADAGSVVCIVSNHGRPAWLHGALDFIKFREVGFKPPRQSGKTVADLLAKNQGNFEASDIIILGADDEDMLMAVNSKTVLIRCEWAAPLPPKISEYGVPFSDPAAIPLVVSLLEGNEPWYFVREDEFLTVYAVTNAGTKFEPDATMVRLANALRGCLKHGKAELQKGFVLHFLSSLYTTDIFREVDIWSYYPSSRSANDGSEVMADFCTLARETFKKTTRGPLFIRHQPSVQRHLAGGDRTDASSQLRTVHLNPEYKGRLEGKTVAVLDDYLTYGVSFGVAAALLKQAGAKKVIAVAMGKFGNSAKTYGIKLENADPFAPLPELAANTFAAMPGEYDKEAQTEFLNKFKTFV